MLDFCPGITHLSIPVPQAVISSSLPLPFIFTQIFLPVEWTSGLATVLVQMAGSNTSLTSASPQPPSTLGRVTQEQSQGAFPATRKHSSAMSSDLATWGQGTIHLSRRLGIMA